MAPALISLVSTIAAPLVRDILTRKIGAQNARLAERVTEAIIERMGGEADLDLAAAERDPELIRSIEAVEREVAPELVALYVAETEARKELLSAEDDEPLWYKAWRPLWAYTVLCLWLWNVIVLHVANAIWKIALPQMDLVVLLQLSALYLSLYMGGHTVKAVASSWGRDK